MNSGKIGQITGCFQDFGISDHPIFIDQESGSLGDAFHIEYEIVVERAIFGGDGLIEIAQEGEIEFLVFFVPGQGKDGVDADPEDLRIGVVIKGDVVAGAAEFFGAGAGKGLGEEKQEDVLAFTVAEGYFLFVGIVQAKIGGRLAGLDPGSAHG